MGRKKTRYSILFIPDAEYLSDYTWVKYYERSKNKERLEFKTEEEAYKYLLNEHFNTYTSRERSLQIILLLSELSKIDPDIAYKMFLTEDKHIKAVNHITIISYLKKNNIFKSAFKAYCDMVTIMGLGSKGSKGKVCFEHYEIVDTSTI